jgi:hypothetical protein
LMFNFDATRAAQRQPSVECSCGPTSYAERK